MKYLKIFLKNFVDFFKDGGLMLASIAAIAFEILILKKRTIDLSFPM